MTEYEKVIEVLKELQEDYFKLMKKRMEEDNIEGVLRSSAQIVSVDICISKVRELMES